MLAGRRAGTRTQGILPLGDFDEFLDVRDLFRLRGEQRSACDGTAEEHGLAIVDSLEGGGLLVKI